MDSEKIIDIFKKHGVKIESGATFSIKGQIAQLINGAYEIFEESRIQGRTEAFDYISPLIEEWEETATKLQGIASRGILENCAEELEDRIEKFAGT